MQHRILELIEYPFTAYTDYPLFSHEAGGHPPIRQIKVLSYDGDKYCKIQYDNKKFEIKSGYIYEYPTTIEDYYKV